MTRESGDPDAYGIERFTTSGFVVTICWADGGYWYHGSDRDEDRSIALVADVSGDGYAAWSGDVRYWVGLGGLVVTDDGDVILDESVVSHQVLATGD